MGNGGGPSQPVAERGGWGGAHPLPPPQGPAKPSASEPGESELGCAAASLRRSRGRGSEKYGTGSGEGGRVTWKRLA